MNNQPHSISSYSVVVFFSSSHPSSVLDLPPHLGLCGVFVAVILPHGFLCMSLSLRFLALNLWTHRELLISLDLLYLFQSRSNRILIVNPILDIDALRIDLEIGI